MLGHHKSASLRQHCSSRVSFGGFHWTERVGDMASLQASNCGLWADHLLRGPGLGIYRANLRSPMHEAERFFSVWTSKRKKLAQYAESVYETIVRMSIYLHVCPIMRPRARRAAGLLLSAVRAGDRPIDGQRQRRAQQHGPATRRSAAKAISVTFTADVQCSLQLFLCIFFKRCKLGVFFLFTFLHIMIHTLTTLYTQICIAPKIVRTNLWR